MFYILVIKKYEESVTKFSGKSETVLACVLLKIVHKKKN